MDRNLKHPSQFIKNTSGDSLTSKKKEKKIQKRGYFHVSVEPKIVNKNHNLFRG